jgi:hypothetical protein
MEKMIEQLGEIEELEVFESALDRWPYVDRKTCKDRYIPRTGDSEIRILRKGEEVR